MTHTQLDDAGGWMATRSWYENKLQLNKILLKTNLRNLFESNVTARKRRRVFHTFCSCLRSLQSLKIVAIRETRFSQ